MTRFPLEFPPLLFGVDCTCEETADDACAISARLCVAVEITDDGLAVVSNLLAVVTACTHTNKNLEENV